MGERIGDLASSDLLSSELVVIILDSDGFRFLDRTTAPFAAVDGVLDLRDFDFGDTSLLPFPPRSTLSMPIDLRETIRFLGRSHSSWPGGQYTRFSGPPMLTSSDGMLGGGVVNWRRSI